MGAAGGEVCGHQGCLCFHTDFYRRHDRPCRWRCGAPELALLNTDKDEGVGGDADAGVWGLRTIYHRTGIGPAVVRVPSTGEELTEGEFRRTYRRGTLIYLTNYADPPDGDEAA